MRSPVPNTKSIETVATLSFEGTLNQRTRTQYIEQVLNEAYWQDGFDETPFYMSEREQTGLHFWVTVKSRVIRQGEDAQTMIQDCVHTVQNAIEDANLGTVKLLTVNIETLVQYW